MLTVECSLLTFIQPWTWYKKSRTNQPQLLYEFDRCCIPLFSYDNNPETVNIRVGASFRSEDQACANAKSEIEKSSFEDIEGQAKILWLEKLSKIEIDVGGGTPPNITEMLYSSLYRASLTPVCSWPLTFHFDFLRRRLRTMQLERLKEYSRTLHPSILILCTAGQVYFSQTFYFYDW